MKSIVTLIAIVLLTLSGLAQVKNESPGSSSDGLLNRKVPGDDLEYLPTARAFSFSLSHVDAPGGVASVVNCREEELKQEWRPMMSPLRQVLDAIVIADPGYRWQIEDGVINLLPVKGEPALLQTRITKFRINRGSSETEAIYQLLRLPEVKKAMDGLDLKPGVSLDIDEITLRQRNFTVKYENVSLRQVLNTIARIQKNGIWRYREMHCDGSKTFTIVF